MSNINELMKAKLFLHSERAVLTQKVYSTAGKKHPFILSVSIESNRSGLVDNTVFLEYAVAICPSAGKGLKKLNAQQSEKFLEFLQNPFFYSFESIPSSFRITKRSRKQNWLRI